MRNSKEALKVLITDYCYSSFLSALGGEDGELRRSRRRGNPPSPTRKRLNAPG
jgi:hypothetical protein